MHPFVDLSAYLDGALEGEPRAAVDAHLAGCAVCATRLAELRSTARLIAALPVPVPSRSLVPRVSVPFWLAPMRTLATVASGAAALLFVASTLIANAPMGTTSGPSQPGSAPGADRNAAPAPALAGSTPTPAPTPAPGAAFSTQSGSPTRAIERSAQGTADEAQKSGAGTTADSASRDTQLVYDASERRQLGPSPWAWLVLAVALGGLALMLQRRLRAA